MRIGTWNLQSLRGKIKDVIMSIKQMEMYIVVITETKKGQGSKKLGQYHTLIQRSKKEERTKRGVSVLLRKDH